MYSIHPWRLHLAGPGLMFQPGARSLLKLSLERTEKRCHKRNGSAGMLEERRITLVQSLQRFVCGSDLTHHVLIYLGPRNHRLRLERDAQIIRELGQTRTQHLLAVDTFL